MYFVSSNISHCQRHRGLYSLIMGDGPRDLDDGGTRDVLITGGSSSSCVEE